MYVFGGDGCKHCYQIYLFKHSVQGKNNMAVGVVVYSTIVKRVFPIHKKRKEIGHMNNNSFQEIKYGVCLRALDQAIYIMVQNRMCCYNNAYRVTHNCKRGKESCNDCWAKYLVKSDDKKG